MQLSELIEQFSNYRAPATDISWRAGAVSRDKKRARALVYAEPRAYEDVLNRLCPADWSVTFQPWGENKVICNLTICGVTRSSTGEYEEGGRGAVAQGTVAEAQAFKRACVKFGLFRYLYDIESPWVEYDEEKRALKQTPTLPARFLPQGDKSQGVRNSVPKVEPLATLPAERADALANELKKLGFTDAEQLELAGEVIEGKVTSLTALTEAQAVELWQTAKKKALKREFSVPNPLPEETVERIRRLADEKGIKDVQLKQEAQRRQPGLKQLAELTPENAEHIISRLEGIGAQ